MREIQDKREEEYVKNVSRFSPSLSQCASTLQSMSPRGPPPTLALVSRIFAAQTVCPIALMHSHNFLLMQLQLSRRSSSIPRAVNAMHFWADR